MFGDGLSDGVVAEWGAVAFKGIADGELIDGLVHGLSRCLGQRLGDIADAAADDALLCIGVGLDECVYAALDFGEQVAGGEFQIMLVNEDHVIFSAAYLCLLIAMAR